MRLLSIVAHDYNIIDSWIVIKANCKAVRVKWPWRRARFIIGWEWPLKFYAFSSQREMSFSDDPSTVVPGRGSPRCSDCGEIIGSCACKIMRTQRSKS